jgi:hypothetical protein
MYFKIQNIKEKKKMFIAVNYLCTTDSRRSIEKKLYVQSAQTDTDKSLVYHQFKSF